MGIREFFYFQKSDRIVFLVALLVAVASLAVIFLVADRFSTTEEGEAADTLAAGGHAKAGQQYYAVETQATVLQPFDPNTADSTLLLSLGLQPYQVRSIYRYRAKGGAYSRPEDFARVYGLTAKKYEELLPYIRIAPEYRSAAEVYGQRRGTAAPRRRFSSDWPSYDRPDSRVPSVADSTHAHRDTVRFPVKIRQGEYVDLNTADTTMLKRVPRIASYFAREIVRYREQLGGYCHIGQLMEIANFPESALDYFTCKPTVTRRINVNQLSVEQMRKHPYLNFYQAKAIYDYRRLKGPLHSLQEMSLTGKFTSDDIERLAPYVEF